jgi:hypothetical protein
MNAQKELASLLKAVAPGTNRLSAFESRLHDEACAGFVTEHGPAIIRLIKAVGQMMVAESMDEHFSAAFEQAIKAHDQLNSQ